MTLERAVTTNREIHPHLHLAGVAGARRMSSSAPTLGRSALDFALVAATIGLCAIQVGVCEAALHQTAAYLNARHQFGRPLSTFQGTMLRAADAAIDIEAMRVTWQNAAWRFDTGRDAADAARVAKWQAAERGQRTVHATQHLHGGMGADITYPIHRYFLWGKQIELLLGGPSAQLARLGADIAERALARAEAARDGGSRLGPASTGPDLLRRLGGRRAARRSCCRSPARLSCRAPSPAATTRTCTTTRSWPRQRGSKDIFMNILTTNGLVGRYVTDWSGPRSRAGRGQHPARRAELSRLHHDVDRLGHRERARWATTARAAT